MSLLRDANARSDADISEGDRIYNNGDQANDAHFGTITRMENTEWGPKVWIEPDNERDTYRVPESLIDPVYKGHGGTRIVPAIEKYKYQVRSLAEMHNIEMTKEEEKELAKRLRDNGELNITDYEEVIA